MLPAAAAHRAKRKKSTKNMRGQFSSSLLQPCAVFLAAICAGILTGVQFALGILLYGLTDDERANSSRYFHSGKEEVVRGSNTSVGLLIDGQLIRAPTTAYHIFQVGRPFTGSTLLTNILIGLFEGEDASYAFLWWNGMRQPTEYWSTYLGQNSPGNNVKTIVSKTHDYRAIDSHGTVEGIDRMLSEFRTKFERNYFVVSDRAGKDKQIDRVFCGSAYAESVLCLDYEEFTFRTDDEMRRVVTRVRRRLQRQFPYFRDVEFNEERVVQRLKAMSIVMDDIRNEPFSFVNHKYGIHGNHRNKTKQIG